MAGRSVGGKAGGLEFLLQSRNLGFEVPPFEVIGTDYYDAVHKPLLAAQLFSMLLQRPFTLSRLPPEFDSVIKALAQEYAGRAVMVRSSSLHEDGSYSFAGVYHSEQVKEPTPENLAQAILSVYNSAYSETARKYRAEHCISDDEMAVIVQEFVEPDWSGVMYTSNPSYPRDLTIEFCHGRNSVVAGKGKSHIVDFDKGSKEPCFKSEGFPDSPFDLERLAEIGMALEKKSGALDIEFAIRENQIFLVQARKITDLAKPARVRIPAYDESSFIGKADVKRGTGKLTLPVVKAESIGEIILQASGLGITGDNLLGKMVKAYYDTLIRSNRLFSGGYVLILPDLPVSVVGVHRWLSKNITYDTDIDGLTSNKRAVITTGQASISSHIMTISRERGIQYAGFSNGEPLFQNVETGDVISIYFKGRTAMIYREETPARNIRELHPEVSFTVENTQDGLSIKTSEWLGRNGKIYANDFLWFLREATQAEWTFEPFGIRMGGVFKNSKDKAIAIQISAYVGQYHWITVCPPSFCKAQGQKPVAGKDFARIVEGYVTHLTS